MEKVLESTAIIRFPDCDPFNHLNNARYLDYFINAREDQLSANYGFNVYEYAGATGLSWVVGQNQIVYVKPAVLMETVVIRSTILRWGERDILVEMQMWDKNKTKLKALLWTVFVHYNLKTQKSELHSAELVQRFSGLENPEGETRSFEKRVAELLGKN